MDLELANSAEVSSLLQALSDTINSPSRRLNMRLINIHTLEFGEFFGVTPPPYAILSHRWGPREMTYKDWLKGRNCEGPGYEKVVGFCNAIRTLRATRDTVAYFPQNPTYSLEWIWVDTCCIDKRSSAELTEAINSMYRWYQSAVVCYVFLETFSKQDDDSLESALGRCEWFYRGWTLQELLAPRFLYFCDPEWRIFGIIKHTRVRYSYPSVDEDSQKRLHEGTVTNLKRIVLSMVGITPDASGEVPAKASVAQKMSWAASRSSTRAEDEAYSLLGIFGVSMPLIYGEGSRAFSRLQEEIMKQTPDDSILAHDDVFDGSALARRPSSFLKSKVVERTTRLRTLPFAKTNIGLEMQDALRQTTEPQICSRSAYGFAYDQKCVWLLQLHCTSEKASGAEIVYWYSRSQQELRLATQSDVDKLVKDYSHYFRVFLALREVIGGDRQSGAGVFGKMFLVYVSRTVDLERHFKTCVLGKPYYIKM